MTKVLAAIEGDLKRNSLFLFDESFANSFIFIDAEKAIGIASGIHDAEIKILTMRGLGKVIASTDDKKDSRRL